MILPNGMFIEGENIFYLSSYSYIQMIPDPITRPMMFRPQLAFAAAAPLQTKIPLTS